MRSWGPADGPVGPLGEALADCAAAGFTGVLNVIGAPGGTIYLTGGAVAAIETSWSPSAEVIMLRSGRVAEADWEAAVRGGGRGPRSPGAELVRRGLVGAGELEALLRTALADAMFAFAAGFVDTCRAEESAWTTLLPLAARRRRRLAAGRGAAPDAGARRLPRPAVARPGPGAAAAGRQAPGVVLGGGRDELLALADGRRTPATWRSPSATAFTRPCCSWPACAGRA